MTALPFETLAALFAGQFILAIIGVLLGFKLLEANWGLGFTGSIALGGAILAAEWYVGDILWNPGFTAIQIREAILAVAAGAILGIAITITLFEPDPGSGPESTTDRRGPTTGARSSSNGDVDIPGGLGEE